MSEQEKKTTLGDPMYVESLMTRPEWNARLRFYPTSIHKWEDVNQNKTNTFKWRFGMGSSLSQEEISNINGNLDYLLKKARR